MSDLERAMKLTNLDIELVRWGDDKDRYKGKARFEGGNGDVRLNLTPEMIDKIFLIAADAVIEQAREAANAMTNRVIEQKVDMQKAHGLFLSSASKQ